MKNWHSSYQRPFDVNFTSFSCQLRTEYDKKFRVKFNKFYVKDSNIPLEALYNDIVNKVKSKELLLNMRPKEFSFSSVDNIQNIKSVDQLQSNIHKPHKIKIDYMDNRIVLNEKKKSTKNDLLKLLVKKQTAVIKRKSSKINVKLHSDHVNYQETQYKVPESFDVEINPNAKVSKMIDKYIISTTTNK